LVRPSLLWHLDSPRRQPTTKKRTHPALGGPASVHHTPVSSHDSCSYPWPAL
jgi:hypothetical protein